MSDGPHKPETEQVLIPARVINEFVYCSRLAWLEWEARAFVDSDDTIAGRVEHRNVDRPRGRMAKRRGGGGEKDDDADRQVVGAAAAGRQPSEVLTAIAIESERLGVVAKLDRVEITGDYAIPVETKHGKPRNGADSPVWEPERAQLTVQALLLREQGYECDHAEAYFPATRTRHRVELMPDPEVWLNSVLDELRRAVTDPKPPPPLVDSPKCPRCSLVSVCMPDEINMLAGQAGQRPRRLLASDSPAKPLYAVTPGSYVHKRGERLVVVEGDDELGTCRLIDVSHVVLFGNASISSGAMRACLTRDIAVLWFSAGGWYAGHAVPHGGSWVQRRMRQYALAEAGSTQLCIAFIRAKIMNQRTLLRRNGGEQVSDAVKALAGLVKRAERCSGVEDLLGVEGAAARAYFEKLPLLVKQAGDTFAFTGRNRRPPTDPANSVLSFLYALLTRDATVALIAAGLDPQVGVLHAPRFGRPSLALDLMEEFRPLVGDSTLLTLINNGELKEGHFLKRGGRVALTDHGRRAVIDSYERRMTQGLTHPIFGYRVSYRRAVELQARLLAAVIDGQFAEYRALTTR